MAAVFAFGKRGANNRAPVSNYLISKGFEFDGVKVGLEPLPQCANSAKELHQYLRTTLQLPREHIINLFDTELSASDQLEQIGDWLAKRTANTAGEQRATDLLVYYTGHGGFSRNDQSYFLAIHKTREGLEGATSIRYIDLASAIKRNAENLRKYPILDCCFAAAAVVKTQADIGQLVMQRVEDALPPAGTAVLCSSAAKLVSIAPPGERYTMFSGALLRCLKEGVADGPRVMNLEDVGKATQKIILERYPGDYVRPELHVPEQARGNPAKVALFPIYLWKPGLQTEEGIVGTDFSLLPPIESWLTIAVRPSIVKMGLGIACGLLTTIALVFIPFPIGLGPAWVGHEVGGIAPFIPALFLATGLNIVLKAETRFTWRSAGLTLIATYVAWLAAWAACYYPYMLFFDCPLRGSKPSPSGEAKG